CCGNPRPGCCIWRGGQDQFNWDDGIPSWGRWQKGKDVSWYAKDKKSGASLSEEQEMAAVREAEHEAMSAALGHKTIKRQPTWPYQRVLILITDLTERRRVKRKRKAKTKHRSRSDSSDFDSESFSKRSTVYKRRKDPRDHHGPNPSRSSQSGAGACDSHSGWGLKAEHRTLTPPHQHRRHVTDSSSDGHRAGRGSPAQSYRRRHDSSSDD
uniref:Multiple myeloma tumor-associated protein 2-like N-terminal domain-containing protein n=1 Tax=Sinocyclocheilus grahami TaxID=75366 RepID=A0A672T0S0_SINGR